MDWFKISQSLRITTNEGLNAIISAGLWRVEVTSDVVTIGLTNVQARIDREQWDTILRDRLALPLPSR